MVTVGANLVFALSLFLSSLSKEFSLTINTPQGYLSLEETHDGNIERQDGDSREAEDRVEHGCQAASTTGATSLNGLGDLPFLADR